MKNEDFDAYIEECLKRAFSRDLSTYVISIENVRKLQVFYHYVKRVFAEHDETEVTVAFNEPFPEMGHVKVNCKGKIVFSPSDVLMKMMGICHSFSITPKTNGSIDIIFGFIDLAMEVQ